MKPFPSPNRQCPLAALALIAFSLLATHTSPAAEPDTQVKLLEPKSLTPGHKVITLFPPGHPALHALAGADKDEIFTVQANRVAKVNNIHNPSIELYLAPPDKAN